MTNYLPEIWTVEGNPCEYVEVYFDTPDFKLLKAGKWLRAREYEGRKDVEWTLKQPNSYVEYWGKTNVMDELARFLGPVPNAVNPVSYCNCAIIALRCRRYELKPGVWVDVCPFNPEMVYAVKTSRFIEASTVEKPAPRKVVAYIAKCRPDLRFAIDVAADDITTYPWDPLGGGPFLPLEGGDQVESDDDNAT